MRRSYYSYYFFFFFSCSLAKLKLQLPSSVFISNLSRSTKRSQILQSSLDDVKLAVTKGLNQHTSSPRCYILYKCSWLLSNMLSFRHAACYVQHMNVIVKNRGSRLHRRPSYIVSDHDKKEFHANRRFPSLACKQHQHHHQVTRLLRHLPASCCCMLISLRSRLVDEDRMCSQVMIAVISRLLFQKSSET